MSTSSSHRLGVLSVSRKGRSGAPDRRQDHSELVEAGHIDRRRRADGHGGAQALVEHPSGNLQGPDIKVRRQAAADHGLAATSPVRVHPDLQLEPRVPAVAKHPRLGTMGVSLLVSTTSAVGTPRWGRSARRRLSDAPPRRGVDGAIPVDAQNAPTVIWKSRTEREIPTPPTTRCRVHGRRRNDRPQPA
jgi:hypothetical protein